jgi:hypothetical protein
MRRVMRGSTLTCLLSIILLFPAFAGAHGLEGMHSEGYIVDVIVIDLECDENETCVSRPNNVVEYFGTDWCEECPQVEQQLSNFSNNDSVIISHRPSPLDDFWLQGSRDRFLDVYGLWGYPTLAIDGHYILAGPTQSRELGTLLSESDSNYSGVTNVSLDNNSLQIEGNFSELHIDVWTVYSNDNLTNIATAHSNLSESNNVSIDGEKLIIVISNPGYIALVSGSTLPANDYTPDGGLDGLGEEGDSVQGSTIIIITVLLLMISLPATLQLIEIMRNNNQLEEE